MRRETAVILFLITVILFLMWCVALTSGTESKSIDVGAGAEPATVNISSDLQPVSGYLPDPVKIGVSQAGAVARVALFGTAGVMTRTERLLGRISHLGDSVVVDGGHTTASVPPYMETEFRRILDYVPAVLPWIGLFVVTLLSWVDMSFATLLALGGLGPARMQFLGTYAGVLSLSPTLTALAYTAYFVPNITVTRARDHWPPART